MAMNISPESWNRHVILVSVCLVASGCGEVVDLAGNGGSDPAGNQPPQISGVPDTIVAAGTTYDFMPTVFDDDGDLLSFRIENAPQWSSFDAGNGHLSGTPSSNDAGTTFGIEISISDGMDTALLPAFDITVSSGQSNESPTLSGRPPNAIAIGEFYDFKPRASDPNGDALQFSITNRPDWATFSRDDGRLFGTPATSDVGTHGAIQIKASDGEATSTMPSFAITVVETPNHSPEIGGNPGRTAFAGEPYSFRPEYSDLDGDSLTFLIANRPGWTVFDNVSGSLLGTPSVDDVGEYADIRIEVSDGKEATSLPPFRISVESRESNDPPNRSPEISGTPAGQVIAGGFYEFRPSATDADGDALRFSISNKPGWASFDTTNGRLSGAVKDEHVGDYDGVRIRVTDGVDTVALPAFRIRVSPAPGATPPNRAPEISGTPAGQVIAGGFYEFRPSATDADGDALRFSISNKPGWASFDTTNGRLSGAVKDEHVGDYDGVRIRVTDGVDTVALPAFRIRVSPAPGATPPNRAPEISGTPAGQVIAGGFYEFRPSATDADGDALRFSISNKPGWASFDTTNGRLSGAVKDDHVGDYDGVRIRVTDGVDTVALPAFRIRVNPAPDATPPNRTPQISGSPDVQVVAGEPYDFRPSATDADGDSLSFSISNKPGWAKFSSGNGRLSGTPSGNDVGNFNDIRIQVSDGLVSTSLPSFDISVTEQVVEDTDPGEANTYYVAPISNSCSPADAGNGTKSDPWTNLYFALTKGGLRPGDTLQLRGGTYRNSYNGFMRDNSAEDRQAACDDDQRSSQGDGGHTVLPIFLSGTSSQRLVIENYPGETVVIDGTNDRMSDASWSQCGSGTYVTSDFNIGSARTPQIWVDPRGADDPGTRLRWNSSGGCSLSRGEFAVGNGGKDIYVRLPGGGNPSNHDIRMSCQGGDCASHPIHAGSGAAYVTVRKNPKGGRFNVKYGYYNGYVTDGAHHLTFDGINWIAGGGRDYGYCFRIHDGRSIRLRNGVCREAMGEGVGFYGGGPQTGIQISGNSVENMTIFDTGRGWVDGGGNGNSLGMGVILKNCVDCTVRGNTIHGSYRSGIQVNHSSKGCPSSTCDSSNPVIENNEIWDFCRIRQGSDINVGQTDCGAILLRADGSNGRIRGGVIRNNMINGKLSVPFSNNAAPAGIYTDGNIPGVTISNNSLNGIQGACINVYPNPNPVRIVGNAMDNCSASGGGCNGQGCALYADNSTAHITRYNTYWAPNGSDQVVRRNAGSGYTRDSVAGGYESTAVQQDPRFMSNTDLRLEANSGLIDAMPCNEAPEQDHFGKSRPAGGACDVGAHEK